MGPRGSKGHPAWLGSCPDQLADFGERADGWSRGEKRTWSLFQINLETFVFKHLRCLAENATRFIFQQRAVDPNQKRVFETRCERRGESLESSGDNHCWLAGMYSPSCASRLLAHLHQAQSARHWHPPGHGHAGEARRRQAAQTSLAPLGGVFRQDEGLRWGPERLAPDKEAKCWGNLWKGGSEDLKHFLAKPLSASARTRNLMKNTH